MFVVKLAVLLVLGALVVNAEFPGNKPKWQEMKQKMVIQSKECADKENVNIDELLQNYKDRKWGEPKEEHKCFYKCMMLMDGFFKMMDESGKVTVPKMMPNSEKVQKCIDDKIKEGQLEDLCDIAFSSKLCIHQNFKDMPKHHHHHHHNENN